MSCNKLNVILLGGQKGSDGIYAVHRNVLFSPVGKLIADALPKKCCLTYARQQSEPELDGISSIVCPDDADFTKMISTGIEGMQGDVLLLSAPMPEISEQEYQMLIDQHCKTGDTVTAMTCGSQDDVWYAALFRINQLREILKFRPQSLTQAVLVCGECNATVGKYRTKEHIVVQTAMDAFCAQKNMQYQINGAWMEQGVTIFDPTYTYISPYARIGRGTTILPGCMIHPESVIGCDCTIGPNTVLHGATIGDRTKVNASQIYESTVGKDATVGPFAYIRPGCMIGNNTRIGDFVELKKASIGDGTKVSHLTYVGDATVGERVNFGCGTVVVNYDGFVKNHTVIGDDCFIGCNTNLVAPVELGDRSLTAAGTTVTRDVPEGALAVARVRQENKKGWNDFRHRLHNKKD